VTTFCIEHHWLLALYNRQTQEEIFGRQPYIIAPGTLAPKGTATYGRTLLDLPVTMPV
jgi:hypothetical protein